MLLRIQRLTERLLFLTLLHRRKLATNLCHVLALFTLLTPTIVWAHQFGIVTAEEAKIYADVERTSPIGYVRRGKKIKLSNIAKNKGSVYATVVSGKLAYISVTDVNTEIEDLDSTRLVAERFQKAANKKSDSIYSLGLFQYSSIISQTASSGPTKDKDTVNWIGAGIKGEMKLAPRVDLQILVQGMQAKNQELETWKMVGAGAGFGYRLVDFDKFQVRLLSEILFIPFASYELMGAYRIRGYGASVGGGLDTTLKLGEHWGVQVMAIYQYMKLGGYKPPVGQLYDAPSFFGVKLGGNLNYSF